jgi:hypothetical protein
VAHVFAIAFMIGTIMIVDLRLLGFASAKRPFTEFSRLLLPFAWVAFAIAVIAGALLFMSRSLEYFGNAVFWTKMVLIVLAGINMAVFEFITVRGVKDWDLAKTPPLAARLAGGISITCWLLVLACGRLIGCSPGALPSWTRNLERSSPRSPAFSASTISGSMRSASGFAPPVQEPSMCSSKATPTTIVQSLVSLSALVPAAPACTSRATLRMGSTCPGPTCCRKAAPKCCCSMWTIEEGW